MAAHAEVAGVVEEDHPAGRPRRDGRAVQRAHQYIIAPWLQQAGAAPLIVVGAQVVQLVGDRVANQRGETAHDQACRFTAGV